MEHFGIKRIPWNWIVSRTVCGHFCILSLHLSSSHYRHCTEIPLSLPVEVPFSGKPLVLGEGRKVGFSICSCLRQTADRLWAWDAPSMVQACACPPWHVTLPEGRKVGRAVCGVDSHPCREDELESVVCKLRQQIWQVPLKSFCTMCLSVPEGDILVRTTRISSTVWWGKEMSAAFTLLYILFL